MATPYIPLKISSSFEDVQIPLQAELYSSLAQSVEHLTVNQGVTGSSPVGGANTRKDALFHMHL